MPFHCLHGDYFVLSSFTVTGNYFSDEEYDEEEYEAKPKKKRGGKKKKGADYDDEEEEEEESFVVSLYYVFRSQRKNCLSSYSIRNGLCHYMLLSWSFHNCIT